jgi:YVTN family beta-propeller protein
MIKLMLRALVVALVTTAPLVWAAANTGNHPTGTQGLLLIDKLGAHVRFFDPVNYQEQSNLALPANPHDFVLSADHKLAYVPIYGDGVYGRNPNPKQEIYVIDTVARKVAGVISVAPYWAPHGIQIDQKGLLYVTAETDRKLLVVDPGERRVVTAIDTEGTGHWIAILPDASKIYVANKNDKPYVSVIDLKSRSIVARVPTPKGTQGIAASPDGKQVVVMDAAEPVVIVIDPATDRVVDRISLMGQTGGGYKAYYSPDGRTLMTMVGSMVTILDTANLRGPQRVLKVGASPMGFAFSADGNTVLAANHGDGTVSVIDLKKAQVIDTFRAGTGIETLTYY